MPEDGLTNYVLTGVTAVVGALATAVAMLWRTSESRNATAIAKLETKVDTLEIKQDESEKAILECEKDRSQLHTLCDFLRGKVTDLEASVKRTA